jgi:peptidoglycan/xylan/chitin deacetylase (PgdA/CDA1 family)
VLHQAGLSGPLAKAAGYARRTRGFLVLKYHRVNDDGDPFFPAQSTEVFERHMAFIARTFVVLPVEELVERMERGSLPRNGLAITFDDGYRDNLTQAAPILARYGLPATIFIATGFVGGKDVPWFDRIAQAVKTSRVEAYRTPWGESLGLESVAGRLAALGRLLERLKTLEDDDLRAMVERIWQDLGVGGDDAFRKVMLSWEDVHALRGVGFNIGAHTVTHPILSRVSRARAEAEVRGSRAMIAEACGLPPRAFAYPNGGPSDYTAMVSDVVREAGFSCAVSTRFGVNTTETPRYELRRGGPWEDELSTFALKLAGYRLA